MAGKISAPIAVSVQGLTKSISQLNSIGAGLNKVGKTAGIAAAGFAAFTAGVKSVDFAIQAIAGARDLERNLAGLKTVFEDVTPQMTTFSKNAVNMGLSLTEASKASTFIGSVLKQSGFDIQQTADLTERLVGLATDLSITYGYDVQEALLGMTALFRGEYDPIEKFGVAMKQSEINAELAARQLDNLTGAERRFAEQQIRVELLFQRSADAQGALQRQTGTLAVEQLKLASTFANVRDTVAVSLLPVIADLMVALREALVDIQPTIQDTFENLEPIIARIAEVGVPALVDGFNRMLDVLNGIIDLLDDLTNPLSELGESFSALIIAGESLFHTIVDPFVQLYEVLTNDKLEIKDFFDLAAMLANTLINALHDVIVVIEDIIIEFQVLGQAIASLFDGNANNFFTTDWWAKAEGMKAVAAAARDQALAVNILNAELANQANVLKKANEAWSNSWIARGEWAKKNGLVADVPEIITGGSANTSQTKAKIKDYVGDFLANLKDEAMKETARMKLRALGASEGLIDSLLASEGWMKLWLQIKQGTLALKDLQEQFNKTAAGVKELEEATKAQAEAWADYNQKVAEIEARLAEELKAIAEHFDQVRLSFQDLMDSFDVLPTIEREIGRFESAVVDYLSNIEQSLKDAFRNGDILQEGYDNLRAYVALESQQLLKVQQQRDDLANRYSLSEALIAEYRSAFTSALNLSSLFNQLSKETQTRTVTEVSKGVVKLGNDLREFNVTVTKSYEETFDVVADKSVALLDNFKAMAEKARSFGVNLQKLRDLGLNDTLFSQLVQAGVEAGGETAQALVDGGSATISEINDLFNEIDAIGADLGEQVAASWYGDGIDMAEGLLAGIMSQMNAYESEAKRLAEAFNKGFQDNLNIAINTAQAAAESAARSQAAAEIAAIPVPAPMIDTAALAQLDSLIAGAQRYIGNVTDSALKAGATVKEDIYQQLRDVVAAGGTVDLSGISSGMSSAALAQAAASASGGVVNNYTVNVTADTRLSGAKAGEAVVAQLKSYETANGSIATVLKV